MADGTINVIVYKALGDLGFTPYGLWPKGRGATSIAVIIMMCDMQPARPAVIIIMFRDSELSLMMMGQPDLASSVKLRATKVSRWGSVFKLKVHGFLKKF